MRQSGTCLLRQGGKRVSQLTEARVVIAFRCCNKIFTRRQVTDVTCHLTIRN